MTKGQVFDLYQDDEITKRVMAINDTDVIDLNTLEIIKDINFENEVISILYDNILE